MRHRPADREEEAAISRRLNVPAREWVLMAVVSAGLILAAWGRWWPVSLTETFGFVTGAVCVWLVVRQHPANWPVGLLNNAFFAWLFWTTRLYADMSLQFVFAAIALYGWRKWTIGRRSEESLSVTRATAIEWAVIAAFVPLGTLGVTWLLEAVRGAAPFWDALTTVLSLAAQYLMSRKRIENWYFWIAADVIYIPLYVSRELPLTAALYGCFLLMCLVGLLEWSRSLPRPAATGASA